MSKFSKTSSAESMALIRTLGYKESGAAIRTEDYMAEAFLSKFMRFMLSISYIRSLILAIYDIKLPGGMPYIMAKSRAIDDMLLQAFDQSNSPEQLIILGAGYDTRCYRFRDKLTNINCFEIDHPEMISRKRSAMKQFTSSSTEHVNDNDSVHYCGADFNGKDNFDLDWLVSQGVDKNKQTLFIIDGVSYFLYEEAFNNLLSVIAKFPENTQVIFDYVYDDILTGATYRGSEAFKSSLQKMGEPVTYGIKQETLSHTMQALGLEMTDLMTPQTLEQLYLTESTGKTVSPYGFINIASLTKGSAFFKERHLRTTLLC